MTALRHLRLRFPLVLPTACATKTSALTAREQNIRNTPNPPKGAKMQEIADLMEEFEGLEQSSAAEQGALEANFEEAKVGAAAAERTRWETEVAECQRTMEIRINASIEAERKAASEASRVECAVWEQRITATEVGILSMCCGVVNSNSSFLSRPPPESNDQTASKTTQQQREEQLSLELQKAGIALDHARREAATLSSKLLEQHEERSFRGATEASAAAAAAAEAGGWNVELGRDLTTTTTTTERSAEIVARLQGHCEVAEEPATKLKERLCEVHAGCTGIEVRGEQKIARGKEALAGHIDIREGQGHLLSTTRSISTALRESDWTAINEGRPSTALLNVGRWFEEKWSVSRRRFYYVDHTSKRTYWQLPSFSPAASPNPNDRGGSPPPCVDSNCDIAIKEGPEYATRDGGGRSGSSEDASTVLLAFLVSTGIDPGQFLPKLVAFGIDCSDAALALSDVVDPDLVGDEDLAKEMGLSKLQVLKFRRAASAVQKELEIERMTNSGNPRNAQPAARSAISRSGEDSVFGQYPKTHERHDGWAEDTAPHPMPSFGINSPVIQHLLSSWTRDHQKLK